MVDYHCEWPPMKNQYKLHKLMKTLVLLNGQVDLTT